MLPFSAGTKLLGPLKTGSAGTLHRGVVTAADGTTHLAAIARLTLAPTERLSCLDEVKAAAAVAHPNIARLLSISEGKGELEVATELVEGVDLGALVERCRALTRPMPPALVAALGGQLAGALAHAHKSHGERAGLVHRHLRPGQVMLTPQGNVKLLGLGTGRAEPKPGAGLPPEHAAYLAPEQLRGLDPDPRADLFSLGVVLFELLTLHLPLQRQAREWAPAPRPSTLALGVSEAWDALLGQLLSGPPVQRLPNAEAVCAALLPLAEENASVPLAQFVRALHLGERTAAVQQGAAEQPSQLEAALSAFTREPAQSAPADPRALTADAAAARDPLPPEQPTRTAAVDPRALAADAAAARDPLPPEQPTRPASVDPRALAADAAAARDPLPPEQPTRTASVDPRALAADAAAARDPLPPEQPTRTASVDPRALAADAAAARDPLPPEQPTRTASVDPRALAADAAAARDPLPPEQPTRTASVDPRALAADAAAARDPLPPPEQPTRTASVDPRALAADAAAARAEGSGSRTLLWATLLAVALALVAALLWPKVPPAPPQPAARPETSPSR